MSDFLPEPEEIEPDRPARQLPLGLVPTADLPHGRKYDAPPCYVSCTGCGQAVLRGTTPAGRSLAVDVQTMTYVVVWPNGAPTPLLYESRGYPVYTCRL